MPKAGYLSVTIREAVYELARGKAEREGMKVSEFTERAIRNYVASLQGLEDKAKLIAEILRQVEEKKPDQAASTRQLTLLAEKAARAGGAA
jgi:hypothetical protein